MKKRHTLLLSLMGFVLLLLMIVNTQIAYGAGAGFTVSANIPDNQYDNALTSFDLVMKPNQTETLAVTLENLEDNTKTIDASANTGYTTVSGSEAFDKYHPGSLSQAEYQFSQIFDQPQVITLKPRETKTVNFKVTMPAKLYNGVLKGALYFKDTKAGSHQKTDQQGFSVDNYYAMALGVILREHPNSHVLPELKLRRIRISGTNYLNEPAILAKLQNIAPATPGAMTISATVSKHKGSKVLFGNKREGITMATNSSFEYGIPLGNNWISPGKYHLHLVAKSDQKTWVFDQDFEITVGQAMKLNRKNKDLWWIWLIILLIIIFIILLITTYYLGYRRRKKQDEKQMKELEKQ
ncbi:DUF916 and DUF3324 domain-containing protein [Latilactobacillus sakei]|uniref:DUF916 and DUF3324 domain-containing protein n=1 Tax=Latilactobacillus sakei TaxID=1599 RepID=A0AAF0GR90_LATSK|nr:DUF916 and DUF3324 domain-containing protein [Latilactobacillus sakei]WGI19104.1 DUF916 and DUF3324 domain-containing protein [Latilactobacillus sakei]